MKDYADTLAAFFAELKKPSAGFCFTISISPETGSPSPADLYYSDHDQSVTFDGNVYLPTTAFSSSSLRQRGDGGVDNMTVFGITSTAVTEEDLIKGFYDDSEVNIGWGCWTNPALGILPLKRGYLGEVKAADQGFEVEVRGLMEYTQRPLGRAYMGECDVLRFGDSRCGLDINALGYVHGAYVSALGGGASPSEGGGRIFQVVVAEGSPTLPNGYFQFGRCEFVSGANQGWSSEIISDVSDTLSLLERPPYAVVAGDSLTLTRGCPRTWTACKDDFNNLVNFRGFGARKGTTMWFMPTDQVIRETPNAK